MKLKGQFMHWILWFAGQGNTSVQSRTPINLFPACFRRSKKYTLVDGHSQNIVQPRRLKLCGLELGDGITIIRHMSTKVHGLCVPDDERYIFFLKFCKSVVLPLWMVVEITQCFVMQQFVAHMIQIHTACTDFFVFRLCLHITLKRLFHHKYVVPIINPLAFLVWFALFLLLFPSQIPIQKTIHIRCMRFDENICFQIDG